LQIQVANGVTNLYGFTHGRGVWRVMVNNSGCNYALSPSTVSAGAAAASGTINVTAQPSGGSWSSTSNAPAPKVSGGGNSDGSAGYMVDENMTFASRVATATIAGKTFTVVQQGRDDIEPPVIEITEPQVTPTVVDTSGLITIGGATRDNNAVVAVTWGTDRGAAGAAPFTGGNHGGGGENPPPPGRKLSTRTGARARA